VPSFLVVFLLAALLIPATASARLGKAERHQINRLLDTFVVDALGRRDPAAAWELASPSFRSGTSRADWRRGDLPVMPYRAAGRTFHHWTLAYDEGDEVGVDLILRPARKEKMGPIAFAVDLKRIRGDWRVDLVMPSATFARDDQPPAMFSVRDLAPAPANGPTSTARPRVGAGFAALPLVFLGAAVVPLLAFGIVTMVRHRRAARRFELGS
jgi:hypothetical protein